MDSEYFILERVEPSPAFVGLICKKRGLQRSLVEHILSTNAITVQQLSCITGETMNVLHGKMIPKKKKRPPLRRVHPFPYVDKDGILREGPIYVVLDKSGVEYVLHVLELIQD